MRIIINNASKGFDNIIRRYKDFTYWTPYKGSDNVVRLEKYCESDRFLTGDDIHEIDGVDNLKEPISNIDDIIQGSFELLLSEFESGLILYRKEILESSINRYVESFREFKFYDKLVINSWYEDIIKDIINTEGDLPELISKINDKFYMTYYSGYTKFLRDIDLQLNGLKWDFWKQRNIDTRDHIIDMSFVYTGILIRNINSNKKKLSKALYSYVDLVEDTVYHSSINSAKTTFHQELFANFVRKKFLINNEVRFKPDKRGSQVSVNNCLIEEIKLTDLRGIHWKVMRSMREVKFPQVRYLLDEIMSDLINRKLSNHE